MWVWICQEKEDWILDEGHRARHGISKKTMTSENKKEEEETPRPPLLATLARPLHPTQEHKYRLLWPGE
jgi:hypothetical protein